MFLTGIISEALLYLCFSLLMGSFLLSMVHESHRPAIFVRKGILMTAAGGIVVLSFVPVLQVILHIYHDIGFTTTLQSVLFTFEVGKAWILTYVIANLLFTYIVWVDYRRKKLYSLVGLAFTIILILTLGWASHVASLELWKGFITHSLHFTAVTIWMGILVTVSWFSQGHSNWRKFLKWFTPVAILCFVLTMVTGLFLMTFIMDFKDYVNTWILSYGQTLLIKHVLIIPLMVFAFINSFLVRKKLEKDEGFDPKPWARVESVVILLIFAATAALGQQAPPHDMETSIRADGMSTLFATFYQGPLFSGMYMHFGFSWMVVSLIVLSGLFLLLMIFSFAKKAPAFFSFFIAMLLFISCYLSIMLSLQ